MEGELEVEVFKLVELKGEVEVLEEFGVLMVLEMMEEVKDLGALVEMGELELVVKYMKSCISVFLRIKCVNQLKLQL